MSSPLFNLNIEIMIYCDDIMLQNNEYSKVYIGDTLHLTTEKEPVGVQPLTLGPNSESASESITYTIHLGKGFTNVQYCKDWTGGSSDVWTNAVGDSNNDCSVSCNVGQTLSIRANWINNRTNPSVITQDVIYEDFRIIADHRYDAFGNVNSLLAHEGYQNITSLANYGTSTFRSLFAEKYNSGIKNGITDASGLLLPCTTLSSSCYQYMFNASTVHNLPTLPATTLASYCYSYMFSYCDLMSWYHVPVDYLPATNLADNCYRGMFSSSQITDLPQLPATTLAEGCYHMMFANCPSIRSNHFPANMLPATTLATNCYRQMFYFSNGFSTAPDLPATTLASGCYYWMFNGCTALNYVKCLATNISATNCTTNWLDGVKSTGTFVKNPSMNSWTTGASGIPSGWTVTN